MRYYECCFQESEKLAEYLKIIAMERLKKVKTKESKEEQQRNHILYKSIEDHFQSFFGSKVRLDAGKRRGKIIIEYTSNEDLERILDLIQS